MRGVSVFRGPPREHDDTNRGHTENQEIRRDSRVFVSTRLISPPLDSPRRRELRGFFQLRERMMLFDGFGEIAGAHRRINLCCLNARMS